jgi:hypothetical protein
MSYFDWKEMTIDISKIFLDYDNPRVFLDDTNYENILRFLIDEEDSIELAAQIYLNRGLPPAEKPVVIFENGKYVVVEGNRRISACKLLYDRSILTERESNKVPKIDEDMKNYLENFPVVLAPDRDSAEPFITMRHAGEKGIKRWSTIATTKRYINRYRKGESINQISRVLGETSATVRKGIRFFMFLEYVRNELSWTEQERNTLQIYKMETTRLDRFLPFSKKAKEILRIDFSADQNITTTLPLDKFKAALKVIIRRVYLDNEIDTRSTMEDVFDSRIISICEDEVGTLRGGGSTLEGTGGSTPEGTGGSTPGGTGGSTLGGTGESTPGGTGESTPGGTGGSTLGGTGGSTLGGTGESTPGGTGESTPGGTGGSTPGGTGGSTPDGTGGSTPDGVGGSTPGGAEGSTPGGGRPATDVDTYIYLTGAYPFTNRYKNNKRINTLLKELKSAKYKENRMSSMYLIRSLLETYTHEYIDYFVTLDDVVYRMKGVARERTKRNQKLRELLFDYIKIHLKQAFPHYEEEIELIDVTFTKNNSTAATKIINFYIHSQTQIPDFHELLDAWKKVSKILNCLDEVLYKRMTYTI